MHGTLVAFLYCPVARLYTRQLVFFSLFQSKLEESKSKWAIPSNYIYHSPTWEIVKTLSILNPTLYLYYRLPYKPAVRKAWLEMLQLPLYEFRRKVIYVCSAHFTESDYYYPKAKGQTNTENENEGEIPLTDSSERHGRRLKVTAVPSIPAPVSCVHD